MKKLLTILSVLCSLLLIQCQTTKPTTQAQPHSPQKVSFKARDYFLKGIFLQGEERYSEALKEFHRAQIFDTTSHTIHNSLAETYFKLNDLKPAQRHVKKALRLKPGNIESLKMDAQIQYKSGNDTAAILAYEKLFKHTGTNGNASSYLLALYKKTNQPLKIIDLFKRLAKSSSDPTTYYEKITDGYRQNKMPEQALAYTDSLIALHPQKAKYYFLNALLNQQKNHISKAIISYEKGIALQPYNQPMARQLGALYRKNNQFDKIITLFSPLYEKQKQDIATALFLGEAHFLKKNYSQTKDILKPLLSHAKVPWGVYDLLGRIALEEKTYPLAIEYFGRVIQSDPRNKIGWLFLGFAWSDNENLEQAALTYQKALKYLPKDADLWSWYGITLQRQEKLAKAIEPFQKALVFDPKNINALSSLPVVLEALDMFAQSDSVYNVALTRLPDNALLLNNFAYSLSERGLQLERCLEMSAKAIEREPNSAAYLDTYGWILYKKGAYEKAKTFILKSLKIRPKSSVVLHHLGDVYYKLNDFSNARLYWKKALQLDKKNKTIKNKLENPAYDN